MLKFILLEFLLIILIVYDSYKQLHKLFLIIAIERELYDHVILKSEQRSDYVFVLTFFPINLFRVKIENYFVTICFNVVCKLRSVLIFLKDKNNQRNNYN